MPSHNYAAVENEDAPVTAEPLPPDGEMEAGDGSEHVRQVRARVVSGAKVLSFRTAVSLGLRGISTLALSRLLIQDDYGLFQVVATVAGLGGYFADFGMGAALVQQQREPTESELTTVFWCQQVFTGLVIAAILISMPWLIPAYKVPATATALLIAMTLGLWLSSLRVVPVMTLERKLRFEAQAGCEMFENVVTVIATVGFAFARLGAWSLVAGGLTGRALGLIAIWFVSPWRPRGKFDAVTARTLLMRGLAFQINSVLPTLLNFPNAMIISNRLGYGNLGYLGWANNLASAPNMLSSVLNRIAFPAYSRLQEQPEELGRLSGVAVQRIGMLLSLMCAPIIIIAPVVLPFVTHAKWIPAIPLFQWGLLNAVIEVQLGLLAQTLSAAGQVHRLIQFQIASGILRLAALIAGVWLGGIGGVAVAAYLASVVVLLGLLIAARQYVKGCENIILPGLKPVLSVHTIVGIAALVGWELAGRVVGGGATPLLVSSVRAGFAFVTWAALMAAYDVMSPHHPIRAEVVGTLRMLRAKGSKAA